MPIVDGVTPAGDHGTSLPDTGGLVSASMQVRVLPPLPFIDMMADKIASRWNSRRHADETRDMAINLCQNYTESVPPAFVDAALALLAAMTKATAHAVLAQQEMAQAHWRWARKELESKTDAETFRNVCEMMEEGPGSMLSAARPQADDGGYDDTKKEPASPPNPPADKHDGNDDAQERPKQPDENG